MPTSVRIETLVILGLLVLGISSSAAATDVPGGNVSGTWTAAGSPYNILGDLTVPAGETLTILPGVEVLFTGFYRLTALGVILAEGSQADSIRFTGSTLWDRIRLENENEASEFAYCVLTGAERGLNSVDSPVSLRDSRLGEHITAVDVFGVGNPVPPVVTIADCLIHDCQQHGIFIVENSNTSIEDCEITRCALDGSPRGAIQLSNQTGGGSNDPVITGNWIHHNTWQGITGFDVTGAGRVRPLIASNVIEYNLTGVYLLYASGELRGNQINHNFVSGDPNSGAGIMIAGAAANPVIAGNTLTGNFTGFYIVEGASANLGDLGNADPTDDGGNHIFGNVDMGGNTWSVYSNSVADIAAENNRWDSEDYGEIAVTIFDGNDNAAYGLVDFDPILDGASAEDAIGRAPVSWKVSPVPVTSRALFVLDRGARAASTPMSILIHDAAGRLVRRLSQPRGDATAAWDGRTDSGAIAPTGTYFCRIQSDGEGGAAVTLARTRVLIVR